MDSRLIFLHRWCVGEGTLEERPASEWIEVPEKAGASQKWLNGEPRKAQTVSITDRTANRHW